MASDIERYGKTEQPIQGTRAFRKPFSNFSKDDIDAVSWIIVNDTIGVYTAVNLYDGEAGMGHDSDRQTYPLKSTSMSKWVGNGYIEANISECTIAEVIEAQG